MDVAQYAAVTKTIPFEFGGQFGQVSYRPNAYTLALMGEVERIQHEQDIMRLAEVFAGLIAGWDLQFNGEPLPVTVDGIKRVPMPLLNAIQDAIGKDMEPSDEEKRGSSERSSTAPTDSTQPAATFPNGSDTSPSLSGSASPSPT